MKQLLAAICLLACLGATDCNMRENSSHTRRPAKAQSESAEVPGRNNLPATPVPEPHSLVLMLIGGAIIVYSVRKL